MRQQLFILLRTFLKLPSQKKEKDPDKLFKEDTEKDIYSIPPRMSKAFTHVKHPLYYQLTSLMSDSATYTDPAFDRSQLISLLNTNEKALGKITRKYYGLTISAYITHCRLEYACRLLISNDDKIESLAMEAGFRSRPTFYRLFREYYGITPDEYRRRRKKKRQ